MSARAAKKRLAPRNPRVRAIDRDAWKRERNVRFRRSVNYAAAAKATRTSLQVTQRELAEALDCSLNTIQSRESGFYSWSGGAKSLLLYQRACMKIAGVPIR